MAQDKATFLLNALSIAASVFSQVSDISGECWGGTRFTKQIPRTLKDFRLSVDAVFKAAGLDKVEWDE